MAISDSTGIVDKEALTVQITISALFTVLLFLVLLYLIYLKRNRVKAEKWLNDNKDLLFSGTWGSMTEVEILEALVKNRGLTETLAQPSPMVPLQSQASGVGS